MWHSLEPGQTNLRDNQQHRQCPEQSKNVEKALSKKVCHHKVNRGTNDLLEVISGSNVGNHFSM